MHCFEDPRIPPHYIKADQRITQMNTHRTLEGLSKIPALIPLIGLAYLSSYAYVRHSHASDGYLEGMSGDKPVLVRITAFDRYRTSDRLLASLYLPLLKLDELFTGRRFYEVVVSTGRIGLNKKNAENRNDGAI